MSIFISSDLHAFHKNIPIYCKDSRGHFVDKIDDMNQTLITNINSKVTDNDTFIIAGDIGFGKPGPIMEFLKALNGEKIIVWGNHDRRLRASPEFESMKGLAGVRLATHYYDFHHNHCDTKRMVAVSHFPLYVWDGMAHGTIMLHGHCHSAKENRDTFGPEVRCMDIGMDGNDLMPYNMDDIVSMMSSRGMRYHGHHDENQNP